LTKKVVGVFNAFSCAAFRERSDSEFEVTRDGNYRKRE
jgi:hypothetical protein